MNTPDRDLQQRLQDILTRKRAKVLVAEDDPVSGRVLKALLEQLGYLPILARSGAEAWDLFEQDPVRLVISDWMMPGAFDGLGLCEKIRNRPRTPYTYLILLTANRASTGNYALVTAAGADDFLTKPLHRDALQMRLRVADRILRYTAEIRQLKELIPICVHCRKVRDQGDYWQRVETYIQKETGSRFSHGACPDCYEREIAAADLSPPTR